MSYKRFARSSPARPTAAACAVPGVPVAAGAAQDVDCLGGLCLPSSFQTGSWLLDHCCQGPSCEPPACPPAPRASSPGRAAGSRQTIRVPSPCSAPCSRPLTFVSSACKPHGGAPAACPAARGGPGTSKRACVSSCRRTC